MVKISTFFAFDSFLVLEKSTFQLCFTRNHQ